jgi:hypothetical protein
MTFVVIDAVFIISLAAGFRERLGLTEALAGYLASADKRHRQPPCSARCSAARQLEVVAAPRWRSGIADPRPIIRAIELWNACAHRPPRAISLDDTVVGTEHPDRSFDC